MSSQEPPKIRGVADIVFLVDATGSMKPCIDELKASIGDFCRQLSSGNEQVDWRARVVGYRDREADGDQWLAGQGHPLVSTEAELAQQLAAIDPAGGGDDPESGLDALWVVTDETSWRPPGGSHRLIVLLTDVAPKPRLDAATVSPGQPNDVLAVGQHLAASRVKVLAWAPMCGEWEMIGKLAGSQLNDVSAGGDVYTGLRNVHFPEVYKTIARTVSSPLRKVQV